MSDYYDQIEKQNPELLAIVKAEMEKTELGYQKDIAITIVGAIASGMMGRFLGSVGTVSTTTKIAAGFDINLMAGGVSLYSTAQINDGATVGDAVTTLVKAVAGFGAEYVIAGLGLAVGTEIIAFAAVNYAISALIDEGYERVMDKYAIYTAEKNGNYSVECCSDLTEFLNQNWDSVKEFHENGKQWTLEKDEDELKPKLTFSSNSPGEAQFYLETSHDTYPEPELFITLLSKIGTDFDFKVQNANLDYIYNYTSKDLDELKSLAREQEGLFAMQHLSPFVSRDGASEQYGEIVIENYSDQYLDDRARFLYHAMNPDSTPGDSHIPIFFDDLALGIEPKEGYNDVHNARTTGAGPDVTPRIYEFGTDGGDDISGNPGDQDDHLYGMGGDDLISGEGGDDYIEGGTGSDTIYSGGGHDTIYTNANIEKQYDLETELTENTVYAGDGNDRIFGSNGSDTLFGDDGNDTFFIQGDIFQYDTFIGGDDFDTIQGSSDDDTIRLHQFANIEGGSDQRVERIDGGEGVNIIAGTDKVDEPDTVDISETELLNIQTITLGAGDDTLKINENKHDEALTLIDGGAGEDTITGGTGNEAVIDLSGLAIHGFETIRADHNWSEVTLQNIDRLKTLEFTGGDSDGGDASSDILNMAGATGDHIGNITGSDNVSQFDLTGSTITTIGAIDLGDKNNTLTLDGAQSEGISNITGGTGQDTISIHNANIGSIGMIDLGDADANENMLGIVGGSINNIDSIQGGSGNDSVAIKEGTFPTIDAIDLGDGENTLEVENVTGTTIGSLTGGSGRDNFSLTDSSQLTITNLNTGDGNNRVDFSRTTGLTIGTLTGGNGSNDEFLFNNASNSNIGSINIGSGNNTLSFQGADVESVGNITGGDGSDQYDFSGSTGNDVLTINTGSGYDRLNFANANWSSVESINMGDGVNSLNMSSANFDCIGSISGGNGLNKYDFSGAALGALGTIDTGSASDTLTFTNATWSSSGAIHLGAGNDTFSASGASGNDGLVIYGDGDNDIITGSESDDVLLGGQGVDRIRGEGGNDTLIGDDDDDERDYLMGGEGYDIYDVSDGDYIYDSDHSGEIWFNGIPLTGGEQREEGSEYYDGEYGEVYHWSHGCLRVGYYGEIILIDGFTNNSLWICLEEEEEEEKEKPKPPKPKDPPPIPGSPLSLDLDGNGIQTVGLDSNIYFDHDGDGFKELTGFIDAGDGLLVLDRNDDGQINNGRELFGDNTLLADGSNAENGFLALQEYDDNDDGVINVEDAVFEDLEIFKDSNQNGTVEEGELMSLSEAGVASLDLAYENSDAVDQFCNEHRLTGSYTTIDGEIRDMTDVFFRTNRADRVVVDATAEISPEIAALPYAVGFGTVHSLHQAMAEDTTGELQALVESFVNCSDRIERLFLTRDIMFAWTGVKDIDPSYGMGLGMGTVSPIDGREILALGAFYGSPLGGPRGSGQQYAWMFHLRFNEIRDMVYFQLMRDSHFDDLFAHVDYTYDELNDRYIGDYQYVIPMLAHMIEDGSDPNQEVISDFLHCVRGINPYYTYNLDILKNQISEYLLFMEDVGFYSPETLGVLESIVSGATVGYDTLTGENETSDYLFGLDGNDTLDGLGGNDTLNGGIGNDSLDGGEGDDIYLFNRGSGKDYITNHDTASGRFDVIRFGDGITFDDLHLARSGDDLVIEIIGTDDSIRVNSHFYNDMTGGYAIDQLQFSDGSFFDASAENLAEITEYVQVFTDGDDELHGYATDDELNGLGGNDEIFGKDGDDILEGGEGNDTIWGDNGDDTLIGGSGHDTIYGGDGSNIFQGGADDDHLIGGKNGDTYRYSLGDGLDLIEPKDNVDGSIDVIEFDESISVDDITVSRINNDLIMDFVDGGQIRVNKYFVNDGANNHVVHEIRFADETVWDVDDIKALSIMGTDLNDTIQGYKSDDVILGLDGSDTIKGNGGKDELFGDSGNDNLFGGEGNDQLTGGSDNDYLEGGAGDDTYYFEVGFGRDTIDNHDTAEGRVDVIEMGEGISATETSLIRENNHLIIKVDGTNDQITVNNYFINYTHGGYAIDEIRFFDRTVWTVDDVKQQVLVPTTGDDVIRGYDTDDTISGLGGNDRLLGNPGDDTLIGGANNDYLSGGSGNDVYYFEPGFGQDTINNYDTGSDRVDAIEFGEGISSSDITVQRDDYNNLILRVNGTSDQITVENYFSGDGTGGYAVDEVRFADTTVWTLDTIKELVTVPTEERDTLYGYASNDTLSGLGGDDELYGYGGNDTLDGGVGNDTLIGGNDNDILIGGADNDDLEGGSGNDVYYFEPGFGQDTISNYDTGSDRVDAIEFGEGISAFDITAQRDGRNNLILRVNGTTDQLTVEDYFSGDGTGGYAVDVIRFADTTVWTLDTIKELVTVPTEERDRLYGYASDDTLAGLGGDDDLYGFGGNDTLDGGVGNDDLNGGNDNDILIGGVDNDDLEGGSGNDVYYFEPGFGQDTIDNYDRTSDRVDAIEFGEGISASDITVQRDDYNNLILRVNGTTDQITVENYFSGDGTGGYAVDEIRFADDTVWTLDTIKERVTVPTEESDTLYGYESDDTLSGLGGDDYLYGYGGSDTLDGGIGKDRLYGGNQDDTLTGGDGNDTLYGGNHNDALSGGDDDDYLYGDGGNDTLFGGSGIDHLYGGYGQDILIGGTGNDYLRGEEGNDVYRFEAGFGQDTIDNFDAASGRVDVIEFGEGIASSDISVHRDDSNNLILMVDGTTDQLTVRQFFNGDGSDGYAVDEIRFADDTVWTLDSIKEFVLAPTEENDTLYGYASDDTLSGLGGDDELYGYGGSDTLDGGIGIDRLEGGDQDDTLYGGGGNDTLYGGNDNDTLWGDADNDDLYGNDGNDTLAGGSGIDNLYGGNGNDILIGGTDNDHLRGEIGNDIYRFDAGFGQDTINNYDKSSGRMDAIEFGDGISASDITVHRDERQNLVLAVNGTTDQLTVEYYFRNDGTGGYAVDEIRFADDTVWTLDIIKELVVIPTEEKDTIYGYAGDDTLSGLGGDDELWGGAGVDTLYGDGGNDTLYGGFEDDFLYGGSNDDELHGDDGVDFLYGGEGNDTLYGNEYLDSQETNHLSGGAGIDTLYGTFGSDIYYFNLGDGKDTIYKIELDEENEEDYYMAFYQIENATPEMIQPDTLVLGAGIDPGDISVIRKNTDLILQHANGTDEICIKNWFHATNDYFKIDKISFSDGTQWGPEYVESMAVYIGSDASDVMVGYKDYDEVIRAGAGNDVLMGNGGNDTLLGGDDYDILIGGAGNDTLIGGGGSDMYIYGADCGCDTIDNSGDGLGILAFRDDITQDRLTFIRKGDSLIIRVDGNEETQVTVTDWFKGSEYQLSYIQPVNADNPEITQYISAYQINGLFDLSDDNSDSLNEEIVGTGIIGSVFTGTDVDDVINAGAGDDVLYGSGGNDTLWGGGGNDMLSGGAGNDTLIGGSGRDIYTYGSDCGSDTIDNRGGGFDVLAFRDDITQDRLRFLQEGDSLIIRVDDNEETQVTVTDWFKGSDYQLSYVQPVNAESGQYTLGISANQINSMFHDANEDQGTDTPGDDRYTPDESSYNSVITGTGQIVGTYSSDQLYGSDESDTLIGLRGNDWLDGGAGNDFLSGASGNDVLIGGSGYDTLYGGNDDDVYIFESGFDWTSISDTAGNDTVYFSSEINKSDIALYRDDTSLYLSTSYGNQITLLNQDVEASVVENFQLEDGSYLTSDDVNLIIQEMTTFSQDNGIAFSSVTDVRNNQDLMNIIAASWHDGD